MKLSPVEDVAAAIAEQVRRHKWTVNVGDELPVLEIVGAGVYALLCCKDASQAKSLVEMMRAPPAPVFDAMNLPETPAFPSIRGKA